MNCTECKIPIPDGKLFCPNCGHLNEPAGNEPMTNAKLHCIKCKTCVPAGKLFCPNCGYMNELSKTVIDRSMGLSYDTASIGTVRPLQKDNDSVIKVVRKVSDRQPAGQTYGIFFLFFCTIAFLGLFHPIGKMAGGIEFNLKSDMFARNPLLLWLFYSLVTISFIFSLVNLFLKGDRRTFNFILSLIGISIILPLLLTENEYEILNRILSLELRPGLFFLGYCGIVVTTTIGIVTKLFFKKKNKEG